MTFELKVLALSIVLGLVQIALAGQAANLQRGQVGGQVLAMTLGLR